MNRIEAAFGSIGKVFLSERASSNPPQHERRHSMTDQNMGPDPWTRVGELVDYVNRIHDKAEIQAEQLQDLRRQLRKTQKKLNRAEAVIELRELQERVNESDD